MMQQQCVAQRSIRYPTVMDTFVKRRNSATKMTVILQMKLAHEALTCYCMFLLMLPGEQV